MGADEIRPVEHGGPRAQLVEHDVPARDQEPAMLSFEEKTAGIGETPLPVERAEN
jgi:hypothetical protein